MGGSASEEFLAVTPSGEDTYVACTSCDYAANVEAATVMAPPPPTRRRSPPLEVLDTPDTPTIDTLVSPSGQGASTSAADTLKNVVLQLRTPTAPPSCSSRCPR